jgi:hypothetical protein
MLIGVDYIDDQVRTRILQGTGLEASFVSTGDVEMEAFVGPFSGTVHGIYFVGESDSAPLRFSEIVNEDIIIEDSTVFSNSLIEASFTGSFGAELQIDLPLVGLNTNTSFTISNLPSLDGLCDAIVSSLPVNNPGLDVDSLSEILFLESSSFLDGLDLFLATLEKILFGIEGILTTFEAPYIQNSLGAALSASTDENTLAEIRRSVLPALKRTFDKIEEDLNLNDDGSRRRLQLGDLGDKLNASDFFDSIARGIDDGLGDFIQDGESVNVTCYNESKVEQDSCGSDSRAVIFKLPIGYDRKDPLKVHFFAGQGGAFPLEIALDGQDLPEFTLDFALDLAIGFDLEDGVFFFFDPDEEKSELQAKVTIAAEDQCFRALLYALAVEMFGFELDIFGGFFVDFSSPPDKSGRLGFLDLDDLFSLSNVSARFGASLRAPKNTLKIDLPREYDKVEKWIPNLDFELYARYQIEGGDVKDVDAERLAQNNQGVGHSARALQQMESLAPSFSPSVSGAPSTSPSVSIAPSFSPSTSAAPSTAPSVAYDDPCPVQPGNQTACLKLR